MSEDDQKATESAEAKLKEITERTGYSHDITPGQRKYGGPPPSWDGPPPGRGHEVFCGKIPKDVLEDELIPLFEDCGTIWDLRLMMDPITKQCRSFCFVTFVDKSSVDTAVKQLDGYQIRPGKKLKVNPSTPNIRLFVGNIPKSKSKDDIMQEFSKFVDGLQDVIIYNVPDDPKKKNRGFTFLDFDSHKTAAAAKKRLTTCRVFGCDIIVDWADPLEEPDEETMSKVKVLYVRNLKSDITEALLRTTFEAYGTVEKVKKMKDYGFVHYADRDCAVAALNALNGTIIGESEMQISLAKPPTDTKLKDKRKLQHMLLLGRGFNQYPGWPMNQNRGMMAMRGGRGRSPMYPGRGGYYGAMPQRYSADYYGSMYGYGADYGGYDDFYCNYGGNSASNYDEYGSYDDYNYYTPMNYGMSASRPGGSRMMYQGQGRGRGDFMYQQYPFSVDTSRGGRGQRSFGMGATGIRGSKRKAMASASEVAHLVDTKKTNPLDSWTSPPIAQQPLNELPNLLDGVNEANWYQDAYSAGDMYSSGQQW